MELIQAAYNTEELQDIFDHGASMLAFDHLLPTITVPFFKEHQKEIIDLLNSAMDGFVEDTKTELEGDELGAYESQLVWAFIEFVAQEHLDN